MYAEEILERGAESVLPSKEKLHKLLITKRLTLYQGFDPTSNELHIGHMVGLRKLAQFQKLGHRVIFLIGDFTGMIGDPTDKTAARVKLTREEVAENAKNYRNVASKFLDFEGEYKAEIKYNSEWLSKLSFEELINLTSNYTVQQLLERDFFQERIRREKPIYLHEFLYPVMQGYDSVAMGVDLEIGGSDQLFNMLAGRTLMKNMKGKEKYVLSMKLLTAAGGAKMGKTEGNSINLADDASSIYGGVMALPDEIVGRGIELLTDLPLDRDYGSQPMESKKMLAYEVVRQTHSESEAGKARENFESTFQKKEIPESDIDTIEIPAGERTLIQLLVEAKLVKSRAEGKRIIKAGGVDIEREYQNDPQVRVTTTKEGTIFRIGKKKFVKIVSK